MPKLVVQKPMSLMSLIPKGAEVTIGLIVFCCIAYFGQVASQQLLTNWAILFEPGVARGEWWRVVSSAFVHGGALHLLVNMVLLYALGQQLERIIGGVRFALLYIGSIATASLAVFAFSANQPTLGASGAVMGVAVGFALILMLYGQGNRHQSLLMLVAMNLVLPLVLPGISFWGHFGGAVGGLLMVSVLFIWPQQVRKRQINEKSIYEAERFPMAKPSLVASVVLVVVLLVASVVFAQ